MKQIMRKNVALALMAVVLGFGLIAPVPASAAASNVTQAQTIMKKFGIPAGPVDGAWGAQTARGLCIFRHMSGLPVSRAKLTTADLTKLQAYNAKYSSLNKIPAASRAGNSTYLVAHKTCQAMTYVENNRYVRVMPISTAKPGKVTPNGNFWLGNTVRGWSCSTIYPETCLKQTAGRFASVSNYGNMYNKRHITGAIFLHGSMNITSKTTTPGSAGCVRVTVADSDWLYDNVGNNGKTYISVVGAY